MNKSPDKEFKSLFRRQQKKLAIGVFLASGLMLLSHPQDLNKTKNAIEDNAKAAYVIFPITEGAAWLGAGIMLASAGRKIGNPLTIKKRLTEVKTELSDNTAYRAGWTLGAIGAVGTSATVAIGAVTTMPESTWPAALGVSVMSIGFSTIPFKPSHIPEEVNSAEQQL